MDRTLLLTEDGSHTLYVNELDEAVSFHPWCGAGIIARLYKSGIPNLQKPVSGSLKWDWAPG